MLYWQREGEGECTQERECRELGGGVKSLLYVLDSGELGGWGQWGLGIGEGGVGHNSHIIRRGLFCWCSAASRK